MLVLQPKTLILGEQKAKLTVTLDLGRDALVAPKTKVQMVIYDLFAYLADQEQKASDADDAGQSNEAFEINWWYFNGGELDAAGPRRRLTMPKAYLSPKVGPGTGVLAVVEMNLRLVQTRAEAHAADESGGGQWYVNEVIGDVHTSSDSPFLVALDMFARRGEDGVFGHGPLRRQIIGKFGVPAKDIASIESPRHLAVRIVSPVNQGPSNVLKEGTVLLSSMNSLDNLAGRTANPLDKAIRLEIKAAQRSLAKPGTPTPRAKDSEPIPSRRVKPDLTGLYEFVSEEPGPRSKTYVAPAGLWLSQAGKAVVGWYFPYRDIGLDPRFLGAAERSLPVKRRVVLMTAAAEDFPNEAMFFWSVDGGTTRIDPDVLIVDPEVPDETNTRPVLLGKLKVLQNDKDLVLQLAFSRKRVLSDAPGVGGETGDDDVSYGVFKRVRGGSRLSWACVREAMNRLAQANVEAIVRDRVEPLPLGWWGVLAAQLVGPEMSAAIRDFSRTTDNRFVVHGVFETITRIISEIVDAFPSAQYRSYALSWLQGSARTFVLADYLGKNKPLEAWLVDVASAELRWRIEAARQAKATDPKVPDKDKDLTSEELEKIRNEVRAASPILRDLGAIPSHVVYEYEFKFSAMETSFNVGVGLMFGVFTCVVARRRPGALPATDYTRTLVGTFGGVSAGIGLKVVLGKGKDDAAPSGAPPSCVMRSFEAIEESDWEPSPVPASFSIAAAGGGLSVGMALVDIQTALNKSQTSFNVRAPTSRDNKGPAVTLSAILRNAGEWDFAPADLRKIVEEVEKGNIFSAQAMLFSLSQSFGVMSPKFWGRPALPPGKDLPPMVPEDHSEQGKSLAPLIGFEKDSSIIQANQMINLDRRLAIIRHLMEVPGWYQAVGYSSPEYLARTKDPDAENKLLSFDRAKAADDFVRASFGAPGQGVIDSDKKNEKPEGFGRKPALLPPPEGGGLLDPFDARSDADKVAQQADSEYPKWRRVDLWVNGWLSARVWAR